MTIIYAILATICVECILGIAFLLGYERGRCDCLEDFRDSGILHDPTKEAGDEIS